MASIGSEQAVVVDEMGPRTRNEGGQSRDEVSGYEPHVGSAIAKGSLQFAVLWGRLAFVVVLSLGTSACIESRKVPRLELAHAILQAPGESYPIELATDSRFPDTSNPSLNLRAHAPALQVMMGLFSYAPEVAITPDPRTRTVVFDIEGCFYQRDEGERVAILGESKQSTYRGGPGSTALKLQLPPPLSRITLDTAKVPDQTIRAIEAVSSGRHRVYIPFQVDGEPYAIDASFKLDADRVWYWSVPGTP